MRDGSNSLKETSAIGMHPQKKAAVRIHSSQRIQRYVVGKNRNLSLELLCELKVEEVSVIAIDDAVAGPKV